MTSAGSNTGIPEATIARLPEYLRALGALSERGCTVCSSDELATAVGVNSAKVRKDLSHLGSYGRRGVGYDIEFLRSHVSREIGLTQEWSVLIAGIGNLGHALANSAGFQARGFRTVALVDADPNRIGAIVAGLAVRDHCELEAAIAEHGVAIGVIATPPQVAQEICNRMIAAGVTSILNFAPVVLSVPEGIDLRRVDLAMELQILAFHAQRRAVST